MRRIAHRWQSRCFLFRWKVLLAEARLRGCSPQYYDVPLRSGAEWQRVDGSLWIAIVVVEKQNGSGRERRKRADCRYRSYLCVIGYPRGSLE
ncbi:hypothetical protein [uncultured Bacteroides sp.]|uniref:hypothetical protein n=1 Tax=uncultured Bacteroides sp. TaxID=162156 RepID=UPI0025DACA9D|nr:hypothetical protein [uncultured Bacteroides sp.]